MGTASWSFEPFTHSNVFSDRVTLNKPIKMDTSMHKNLKLSNKVALVEHSGQPMAFQLVNEKKVTVVKHEHLMELAGQIATADSHIKATTTNKLKTIKMQIEALQEQARQCLEDAKRDKQLHQAACNLVKKPGHTYYLYEKVMNKGSDGKEVTQAYFSILSPGEWGKSCPNKFLGAYVLGYDQRFTPLEAACKQKQLDTQIEDIYNRFT